MEDSFGLQKKVVVYIVECRENSSDEIRSAFFTSKTKAHEAVAILKHFGFDPHVRAEKRTVSL